jgi:hypothetical protein
MIMMLGAFTMWTYIHADINQKYGVQNNHSVSAEDEYQDLQNTIKSDKANNTGLLEKTRTLSDPLSDPFATIGAGLFIVPQLLSLLTAPLDIMDAFLGDLGGTLAFIPPRVRGFLYLIFAAALIFGVIELLLRVNEA